MKPKLRRAVEIRNSSAEGVTYLARFGSRRLASAFDDGGCSVLGGPATSAEGLLRRGLAVLGRRLGPPHRRLRGRVGQRALTRGARAGEIDGRLGLLRGFFFVQWVAGDRVWSHRQMRLLLDNRLIFARFESPRR